MTELRDALSQIREIRARVAGSQTYRGYRVAPTVASALLALLTAFVQAATGPVDIHSYVVIWGGCALLSILLAGLAMLRHCAEQPSALKFARTRDAIVRIAPPLIAGAVVTWVLIHSAPALGYLLPGLWQIFFALGLISSARLLPDGVHVIGGLYFVSGCFALSLGPAALAPAVMGVPFVFGQAASAWVLFLNRERRDVEE